MSRYLMRYATDMVVLC